MAKKVKSRTPLKNHEKNFLQNRSSTNTYSYFYKLSKRNNRRSTPQPNIFTNERVYIYNERSVFQRFRLIRWHQSQLSVILRTL